MKRRQNEQRDRRIKAEFERSRRQGEPSREMIRKLADKVCRSEKRIEAIVYPREEETSSSDR